MTDQAILATFSDAKVIKTRSTLQLVFEVPLERADEALRILGGLPQPGKERWAGIALAPGERLPLKELLDPASKTVLPPLKDDSSGHVHPAEKKTPRPFASLQPSAQAGIRCSDETFWNFLNTGGGRIVANSDDAAKAVRSILNVKTRAELNTDEEKLGAWNALEESFQSYLTESRYASVAR